ncbi:ead/Ea22-like family protein [Enterobacter kobei]|uniref:ead/Ea22-like family protein n=1 Tax=Enterobacter kobei TaxID=208224 RepID=UPI0028D70130|nr:ead/Ea22-like family protein [Enterobacter kobei]WNP33609.1 ead/Ea22-like family protein [Enterobacter kobei]
MTNITELTAKLKKRYALTIIPKCRVCGEELTLQRTGAGGDVWACSGLTDGGYLPGRSMADEHYAQSRWTDYSNGGDEDVLALTEALEAAEKRIAELEAKTLTVKLPEYRNSPDMHTKQFYEAIGFNQGLDACAEAMCTAGIKLQIEGE